VVRSVSLSLSGRIADNPDAGHLPTYVHSLDAVASEPAVRAVLGQGVAARFTDAVAYDAPVIDTAAYLAWLRAEILQLGGIITYGGRGDIPGCLREFTAGVRAVHDGLGTADVVVINCTGVGAGTFTPDPAVYPCRGQVLHLPRPPPAIDERQGPHDATALYDMALCCNSAYLIPSARPDGPLEMGGTADNHRNSLEPDLRQSAGILARVCDVVPAVRGLAAAVAAPGDAPLRAWCGLRPMRTGGFRLEAEAAGPGAWVVHNYGYGGSGYTCSWGAAQAVADLVDAAVAGARL